MKKAVILACIIIFYILVLNSPAYSIAYWIIGNVSNATDKKADNHTVVIYYTSQARSDGVNDTIGPLGLSGISNKYQIDCKQLSPACDVNNNITVEVINTGDSYVAGPVTVKVSGAGFDEAPAMTLRKVANDFSLGTGDITFSDNTPVEGQNITIIANITNVGDAVASLVVAFYKRNYTMDIQIGNSTMSIDADAHGVTNITWLAAIGTTQIFVVVDPPFATNGSINETDETNNDAWNNVTVSGWETLYGWVLASNMTIGSGSSRLIDFINVTIEAGNVVIVDSGSTVSFYSLHAIGRTISGAAASNDFDEIDDILGMENFSDSVNVTFSSGGSPIKTLDYSLYGRIVADVPITNTTNSTNFVTGMVWDYSDDTDGEFDSSEREDLLFVSRLNVSAQGLYGRYDYEIKYPALLRTYNGGGNSVDIYLQLYYD
ncbi:MAG: CARDB domain-containing protein [archaeon]